jgi:uncharacterized protein YggE
MKLAIPLLLFLFCSCSKSPHANSIRVSGEGKIRVMPDQVILTIAISFTQPRMVDAVRLTQQTVDSVQFILEKYGNKNRDIKTSSISANKAYQYIGNRNQFVGYQAQQTIDFVLNDISRFTDVTGKLLETKISSISQIQFNHSKADSLFREADLLAYDDALKSANKLSARANVTLGNLLFLSNDNSNPNEASYSSYDRIETYNKGYGGSGFKISPEVIEFRRTIKTEYAISD